MKFHANSSSRASTDVRNGFGAFLSDLAYGGSEEDDASLSFADWSERYFYIPETNGPIWFNPRQRAAIEEATKRDENGKYLYSNVLMGDVKKSGKTTIVACRVLNEACTKPNREIRVVGNDLRQAQSRVYKYVDRAIMLANKQDPKPHPMIKGARVNRNTIKFPNGSIIEAVPVDPRGEAGGNDDLVVFTELWGASSEAHMLMWTETVIPPQKYGEGQRWVDSYAGYINNSPLLWNLYESTVLNGEQVHNSYPFYRDSSGLMFTMWNHDPDLPWQTAEYYEQQKNELTPNEFLRIHRNQWVERVEVFIEEWVLEECTKAERLRAGNVYVGVDAAVERDFCAIVVIRYNSSSDKADVIYEKVFKPHQGEPIDLVAVEKHLYKTLDRYKPLKVAYDPYQLTRIVQGYKRGRKSMFQKIEQGKTRNVADGLLRQRIIKGNVRLDKDSETYKHLATADIEIKNGRIRLVKRSGRKSSEAMAEKIDAAVALSMACYVAETTKIQPQAPAIGAYGQRVGARP